MATRRKIVVLTDDMVMFNVLGTRWMTTTRWSTETGTLATTVNVLAENPANQLSDLVVASFANISAIYFDDNCSLIKPED